MQFHGRVQKSLVKSQRSSAITCSLQESEHMNISREDTGLLESKTCFSFYSQATDAGNHPIPISVSTFSYRMLKTRDQPCTTPLTSVLATNKADTRNSALWNSATSGRASRGHQTNSGYPESTPCLQTGAHTDRAWTSACMCQGRFSAGAAHVMGDQVLGPCAPQPSCFAGLSPDPVDFTTSEPGKCKVDSQSKAGGNRRQEPREVLQGEALTRSQ